ncbi:hypothetical protein B0T12DRAFT_125014 [Alternaria alternata]|nr:hypothetical protein B0T12DRAFT_125014 [Alternaria alternata]
MHHCIRLNIFMTLIRSNSCSLSILPPKHFTGDVCSIPNTRFYRSTRRLINAREITGNEQKMV